MKKYSVLMGVLVGLMGLVPRGAMAQSGARTSDVIGTYYGAIQCVLDTDNGRTADHNFPEFVLTGLLSFFLGWNNVGFHQGAQGTLGYNGQTTGGIFFLEGLPYSVNGDFLVVPFASPGDQNGGKNNTDVDYQLDISSLANIGLGSPVGDIENVLIAGKLKPSDRSLPKDWDSITDSGATNSWSLGYYLESGRGNRKVRYRDTDRDPIKGDTVIWLSGGSGSATQNRYDEWGAPQGAATGTSRMEQFLFEAARISKTPGDQAFGDKVRVRR